MKALTKFLVKLPQKFKDTISIAGQEMYLASKFDEFSNRINYAEVVSTPAYYPDTGVEVGDILYFHHHVVIEKTNHFMDDIYTVQYDPNGGYGSHAYAYEKPNGDIFTLSDWVFVRPPEEETEKVVEGIIILEEKKDADHGEVVYANKELTYAGASIGDIVHFSKNSDYPMEVKGDTLWRMRITDLLYKRDA